MSSNFLSFFLSFFAFPLSSLFSLSLFFLPFSLEKGQEKLIVEVDCLWSSIRATAKAFNLAAAGAGREASNGMVRKTKKKV